MTTATQTFGKLHQIAHAILARLSRETPREQPEKETTTSYFDAPTSADVMARLHIRAYYGR